MKLLKRVSAIAVLALSGALAPQAATADLFNPEVFTLDNGLTVAVIENNRAPVVTHMMWYKVGSVDELPGKSGIAHFFEHLMFKGTEKIAPGEYSRIIRSNAGNDNASTSYDYTNYFQSIHRDKLELVMELEADRMVNLRLSDEVVDPERDVVLDERRQRIESSPGAELSVTIDHTMLPNSPYGRPIIGWEHEIQDLSTEDALDWYRRWTAPNNAILVVSGDTNAAEVRRLAEKHYGPIPARDDIPDRLQLKVPPMKGTIRIAHEDDRVKQPEIRLMWLGPCRGDAEPEEILALDVFVEAFSHGSSSRLYKDLVIQQQLATNGGLYHWSWRKTNCQSTYFGSPADGVSMDQLEAAMRNALDTALEEGLTEDQIAKAVRQLKITATFARDSVHGPAFWIGQSLVLDAPLRGIEDSSEILDSVTPEQVMAAARKVYSQPPRLVAKLIGPTETAEAPEATVEGENQ